MYSLLQVCVSKKTIFQHKGVVLLYMLGTYDSHGLMHGQPLAIFLYNVFISRVLAHTLFFVWFLSLYCVIKIEDKTTF
jgi:hypothetical protein